MGQKLLIAGANGLVGQGVLKVALHDPSVDQITLLVRKPMPVEDPRVRVCVVSDFSSIEQSGADLSGLDACLYCAGVLPVGMGEQAYRKVTVDVTLAVARAYARANPTGRFLYVSGAGADARSWMMPLKVKGEAEEALKRLGIACCNLRPGIIRPVQDEVSPHGARQIAYRLSAPVLGLFGKLVPSVFTSTRALGKAMLALSRRAAPLPDHIDNAEINTFDD